jgi:RND family efflux transporter MFP subunit
MYSSFNRNTLVRLSGKVLILTSVLVLSKCKSSGDDEYTVMKGLFRQSITETGELQALNASILSMPRINSIYGYNLKIISLAEHGKTVRKGESVITVDPSSVQKYIIERRESLENEMAAANKLRVQLSNSMQDLRAQLKNEQSQFNIKKLERDKSAFESEGIRKVIELEYRQSELRMNRLKRSLELKPKLDSLDFRIQSIKVIQKRNELRAAMETLKQLTVCSPLDGIFVIQRNPRTGQMIKLGEEMYVGYPVAKIPDIRTMKVEGIVAENDISKVKTGLKVIIRLDALPSVPFHGTISKVSKVCIPRDQKKIFTTEVMVSESDPRLKPGMTVSCEYITSESSDAVYVPVKCLLEENKHYYVYVKKRGKIRKTEVKTGPSNNLYTVISGDVKPGQSLFRPESIIKKQ